MSEHDKGPLYHDNMPWYHWVAAYTMIGAGFVFMVVPEKSIMFIINCIAMGYGGYWIATRLPREKKSEPHK